MKKTFLAITVMMGSFAVVAQVESTDETLNDTTTTSTTESTTLQQDTSGMASASLDTAGISDDDLRKYAVVMDSINTMKKNLLTEISDMVKGNESMTNARYNELSKAGGDEEKLREMKATEEEIAFVKQVNDRKNEGASEISETFQTLARDYIGVETYNEVKNALAADSELKARYDTILNEVENEESASTR
jgi:hypothetical protein